MKASVGIIMCPDFFGVVVLDVSDEAAICPNRVHQEYSYPAWKEVLSKQGNVTPGHSLIVRLGMIAISQL